MVKDITIRLVMAILIIRTTQILVLHNLQQANIIQEIILMEVDFLAMQTRQTQVLLGAEEVVPAIGEE